MRNLCLTKCFRALLPVLSILLAGNGCGGGSSSSSGITIPPPPVGARDQLTTTQLMGQGGPGVVHNDYYQPRGSLRPVSHSLCGTIQFTETRMDTTHYDADWRGTGHTLFPAFSLPLIVDGDWLIPLDRNIILSGRGTGASSGGSVWNVIVNPGEVWEEVDDGGYSRAAFPFTFTDNYVGQARNGIATLVFDGSGVSSVAIQVTQETAPVSEHDRVDFSALVPAYWDPTCPPGTAALVADFQDELAGRLPIRPWSDLPDAAASQATSRAGLADTDFSMIALLMDGELFVQPVTTRSGPHPWPEWMRHGVYSVTKSMALGVSMYYLAQWYGDHVFDELITDYVPELANHSGWQNVTFHHVLNMVTGVTGGERGSAISPFIMGRSSASKMQAIQAFADAPAAPGSEFAYYSTHSFVLSYAMNRFVQSREGPDANYWQMVIEDVLEPIGVRQLPVSRTFEVSESESVPIMGWGSYPDVDTAAKIAQLLQDDGVFNGQQLLSPTKVREALRRTNVPDYPTGHAAERYLHSVWTVSTNIGGCSIDVPLMSGYGGNHVMMLPSGLSVIRFMDADDYEVSQTVQAVERYRSSC
jgi:CubicO group peptidase (beta-lactamase class C family)